jgi:glutamate carboxypeptidase
VKRQTKQQTIPATLPQQLLARAKALEPQMLARLRVLVAIESPSADKASVDRAAAQVAGWALALKGRVKTHRFKSSGNSLEVRFGPRASARADQSNDGKPILLLGHLDTVWPVGTLRTMPFQVTGDQVRGPGVFDMKSGVVMMLTAIEMLQEQAALKRPVIVLLHGDEEVGSPASRSLTERIAQECSAVYVLEPAQGPQGAYKTARKGVGHYRLAVHGVASHAGVDFTSGHSAIMELARQLEAVSMFTDLDRGITMNPGVIGGGSASNVIAAEAWAEIDMRVATARDAVRVDRALHRLRPHDKACRLELTGGLNRPPMVRTSAGAALFRKAQQHALQIGLALEEASTGGGSDGNFTAALGIPTLDGMGPVGAGAHAPHEHLLRPSLANRTALLAAMLV